VQNATHSQRLSLPVKAKQARLFRSMYNDWWLLFDCSWFWKNRSNVKS